MRGRAPAQTWLRPTILGGGVFVVFVWIGRQARSAYAGRYPGVPAASPPPPLPSARASVVFPTSISDQGTRFVAQLEGFDPKLVNDEAGHCTIGFGHLVHPGPCNGSEPAEFKRGITRERGLELLAQETSEAAEVVSRLVTVPLAQAQFDALVSFAFNVGQTSFATSTLLKLLNPGGSSSQAAGGCPVW